MKKLLKYSLLIFGIFLISSCELTRLDLLDNPNEVTPDKAELNLVYNNVMIAMGSYLYNINIETMPYVRMIAMTGGNQYINQDSPASFDNEWSAAYATLLPDIDLVIDVAGASELTFFTGSVKVLKAYILMSLVDLFGDVPYSEAGKGAEVQNPIADSDRDVYTAAYNLLKEAITELSAPVGVPNFDLFYGGNAARWKKAANSLIIRYHVTTKLAGGNAGEIGTIVSSGDYITSAADDFVFNYGTNRVNPNSRHPWYTNGYEAGGAGFYQSNYYMWSLFGDKDTEDPRLRYYFFRQDCDETNEDQFTLDCPFEPYPFHWENGFPFCTASSEYGDPDGEYGGYWGRDHGDASGIPPDGFKRTVFGIYPAAGKFDGDQCRTTSTGGVDGAGGGGIIPVVMSSFVDFLLAEAVLTMGVSGDARALLESGITKSISKVMAFKGGADVAALVPSSDQITAYVQEVLNRYDAAATANEKLDVVMKEYWIAAFGNGMDTYNNYRRTGFPSKMQRTLEVDPGRFARSFWYPSDFVNLNSNITQNKDISDQIFWDTNPAGFIY